MVVGGIAGGIATPRMVVVGVVVTSVAVALLAKVDETSARVAAAHVVLLGKVVVSSARVVLQKVVTADLRMVLPIAHPLSVVDRNAATGPRSMAMNQSPLPNLVMYSAS